MDVLLLDEILQARKNSFAGAEHNDERIAKLQGADKNRCKGPFSNRGKASMRHLWRINRDSITRTHQASCDNPRHYPGAIVRSWSCAQNG